MQISVTFDLNVLIIYFANVTFYHNLILPRSDHLVLIHTYRTSPLIRKPQISLIIISTVLRRHLIRNLQINPAPSLRTYAL